MTDVASSLSIPEPAAVATTVKRQRAPSPSSSPLFRARPLPPLPPSPDIEAEIPRALDVHPFQGLGEQKGQDALLTVPAPASKPSESHATVSKKPSLIFDEPAAKREEAVHPTSSRKSREKQVRRAQSFNVSPLNTKASLNAASKSSDHVHVVHETSRNASRKGSLLDLKSSLKGKEKENDSRTSLKPKEPTEKEIDGSSITSQQAAVRRKPTFGFLRRMDERSTTPSSGQTSTLSNTPASLPTTPRLSSSSAEAPVLPEVETGSSLLMSFDETNYPLGDTEREFMMEPEGYREPTRAPTPPAIPMAHRSQSEMSPPRPTESMTRPRSSTGGSKSSLSSRLKAGLRRSNSISSTTSSIGPSLPLRSPSFASSSPTLVSPTLTNSMPPSRRPSANALNMFGGLLRLSRRRSSANSLKGLFDSTASSSMVSMQRVSDSEKESTLLESVPEASASFQLLPPPLSARRKESTSSLSSSASPGRTSDATTEATSQMPELTPSRKFFGSNRSRSNSVLQSPLTASMSKISLKPEQDESPEHYLSRLREICSPTELARVLASTCALALIPVLDQPDLSLSSDALNVAALQAYISSFDFAGLPIDIAVRKLLMDLVLPRETQQIDRVMEAFAKRYHQQNIQLFVSADQPYLLAFAMIMLHTDAFNTNNRNKMSKAAFVKNTQTEGVSPLLLEYLFDNTCFSPFIFVEEEDVNGQRTLSEPGSATFLPGRSKVDPYHMISNGLTRRLRAEVDLHIPTKNPYSFTGTVPFFNSSSLHQSFAEAPVLRVLLPPRPGPNSSAILTEEVLVPGAALEDCVPLPSSPTTENMANFKISKVGLLYRKDFVMERSKKASAAASRKWREWSVILTGSQLLFFRDPIWGLDLSNQVLRGGEGGLSQLVSPRSMLFRPDAIVSLKDAMAIYDWTFTERANSFTLLVGGNRQYQLQAPDAAEMNEWIATINYAATFKTVGVRMRGTSILAPSMSSTFQPNSAKLPTSSTSASLSTIVISSQSTATEKAASPVQPSSVLPEGALPSSEDWDDDHVFEQFSSSDIRYRPNAGAKSVFTTRSDLIRNKVVGLEVAIAKDKMSLQTDLRLARNFSVLTPFRTSTRSQIQEAVWPLAKRVRSLRLALCKSVLMREVLARDLLAEEREVSRARQHSVSSRPSTAEGAQKALRRSLTDTSLMSPTMQLPLTSEALTTNGQEPANHDPEVVESGVSEPRLAIEDEVAVAWVDTRAGRRVSLVQMPTLKEWPGHAPDSTPKGVHDGTVEVKAPPIIEAE